MLRIPQTPQKQDSVLSTAGVASHSSQPKEDMSVSGDELCLKREQNFQWAPKGEEETGNFLERGTRYSTDPHWEEVPGKGLKGRALSRKQRGHCHLMPDLRPLEQSEGQHTQALLVCSSGPSASSFQPF